MAPRDPSDDAFCRRWVFVTLGVVVALGFVLRLRGLGSKSLWVDEIGHAFVAFGGPMAALRQASAHVAAAPLDYIVTSLVLGLDTSDAALRFPAALWGTASIAVLFLLGRRLSRRTDVALTAAFLLSVCPSHVRYSQELRFYSLFVLLSLCSLLGILVVIERGRRSDWALCATALAGSFLSHYYTIFVALSGLGLALLSARGRETFIRLVGLTVVCAAPLALFTVFSGGGPSSAFLFSAPGLPEVLRACIAGEYHQTARGADLATFFALWLLPALAVCGAVVATVRGRRHVAALAVAIVASSLGVLVLDWRFSYFWAPRQFLFLVPLWLLLAADGASSVARELGRRLPGYASAAVLGALAGAALYCLEPALGAWYATPKENWRAVSAQLAADVRAGRAALISDPDHPERTHCLGWYARSLPLFATPRPAFQSAVARGDGPSRAWSVADPEHAVRLAAELGWSSVDLEVTKGFHLTYLGGAAEETLLSEIASHDPRPELLVHSDLVQRLRALDPGLALRTARRAVERTELGDHFLLPSELAWLYTTAGRLAFEMGSPDEAWRVLRRAVDLDDRNVEALNNLGLVAMRRGAFADAERVLRRSARLDPRSYWAHVLLADTLRAVGRAEESDRTMKRAASLRPR